MVSVMAGDILITLPIITHGITIPGIHLTTMDTTLIIILTMVDIMVATMEDVMEITMVMGMGMAMEMMFTMVRIIRPAAITQAMVV